VFLDIRHAVFYGQFMEKILSLLFSAMLVFAGFGSVPRCYVMQPDCAVRDTVQCPLVRAKSVTAEKGCTGCSHMSQKSVRQQKTHTVPPADRLARFSVDQDRHSPDLSPDCVPSVALVQNSWLFLADPMAGREILPDRSVHLPEPPLLILLQKQSLLI
jgi:hypothetical protein